jgi:hypothetical protein
VAPITRNFLVGVGTWDNVGICYSFVLLGNRAWILIIENSSCCSTSSILTYKQHSQQVENAACVGTKVKASTVLKVVAGVCLQV